MMTPRGMRAVETLQKMSGRRAEYNEKRREDERRGLVMRKPIIRGKNKRWPFQFMEIGDVIEIHADESTGITLKAAIQAAHSYGITSRKSFQCRTEKDGLSVKVERMPDPEADAYGKIIRHKKRIKKVRVNHKWPFKDMLVGETILIIPDADITVQKIMAAAHSLGSGRKFRCRMSVDGKNVSVYRIS